MASPAIHLYTSPRRPLDIGYVSRAAKVGINWDHTEIGYEWHPGMIYAFDGPLPKALIEQLTLTYGGTA